MPRQVKVAILLSSIVLVTKAANNLWKIANDSEGAADAMFLSLWLRRLSRLINLVKS